MKNRRNKSGGVLVMVMVVLVSVTTLAAGLFKLNENNAVESVYVEQLDQAFWVAEAGLQRALNKLRTNKSYRESLDTNPAYNDVIEDDVGGGHFEVKLRRLPGAGWRFEIESLGMVRNARRRLFVETALSDIGNYSIIALNVPDKGSSELGKDGTIDGNVYHSGGTFKDGGADITGTVYVDDPGNKPWEPIPEDGRLDLSIDQGYYASYFSMPNTGSVSDPLVLSNGTVVVSSSLDVSEIVGPGTVVVKANQTFSKDLVIHDNVTVVVDGNLTIRRDASFGNNVVLFSTGTADLFKNAKTTVDAGEGCAFLSLGDMKVWKDFDFDGLLYSGGTLYADKDMDVTGTIITQKGFDLKKNATLSFDAGVIPAWVLDSMFSSTYIVQSSRWKELAAN